MRFINFELYYVTWHFYVQSVRRTILYSFYIYDRCDAGGINKFEHDFTQDQLDVTCDVNNTFTSVEWPTCVKSKSAVSLRMPGSAQKPIALILKFNEYVGRGWVWFFCELEFYFDSS